MNKENDYIVEWATKQSEILDLGAFFANQVITIPEYISHGEVQFGLSADGSNWNTDALASHKNYFQRIAEGEFGERVIGVWDDQANIIGVAVIEIVSNYKLSFAIIQDVLVDNEHRDKGVGRKLISFLEQELKQLKIDWIFLESGKNNKNAHKFFRDLGYEQLSVTFGKPVSKTRFSKNNDK